MQKEEKMLLKVAIKLVKALDKITDEHLPERLADIVRLHSGIAVGSAFIPIPGVDIAASAGNIWTMYVRINKEIGVPFSDHLIKSIASGVATNLGAFAAASLISSSILKLTGVGTLFGSAIMAATIYALTNASGIIYMKALTMILETEKLGGSDLKEETLNKTINTILNDKELIKNIIDSQKEEYKKSKKE